MPISRVRSVTETSMMFMMPMPPTSRLTAATAPSNAVRIFVVPCSVCCNLRGVEDVEIVRLGAGDVAALAQQRLDRRSAPRQCRRRRRPHHDRADVAIAGEAALHRLDRHQHDVVLVVAEAALASRDQRADHLAGQVANAEALADRLFAAEQVALHGGADDADRLAGLLLGRAEDAARRSAPIAGPRNSRPVVPLIVV